MKHSSIYTIIITLLVLILVACSYEYEPEPLPETGITTPNEEDYEPTSTPTPLPDPNEDNEPSPTPTAYEQVQVHDDIGKIAIITHSHIAQQQWSWVAEITGHFGPQNTIVYPWAAEIAQLADEIIGNPDIQVLLINPAGPDADNIAAQIRDKRDDIFIIFHDTDTWGAQPSAPENANLFLRINEEEMVRAFPTKARELGASVIAYFYDTETWCDLTIWEESHLHTLMREASAEAGLLFVEIDILGAMQCGSSTHMYMSEAIPPLLEEHGPDIVFVGLCNWRTWGWVNSSGAVYLPLLQTWFTPDPIDIAGEAAFIFDSNIHQVDGIFNVPLIINDIRHHLNEAGQLGRAATFPMAPRILFALASIEYGMRWSHGEDIDIVVLEQIMTDIITQFTGEHVDIGLIRESEGYLLVSMGYLVF